ncbi:penicillin-binding protein 1A [Desulfomonile tiedjei]|uniref:penicillin-binding protein 1A n=1 Tax=Desulfomonile tiedjei TaxID=2358 RepID=UPI0002D3211D|nr:PBP1A family penicillin-binding protein [Desulfomonile tiedjei]
MRGNRKRELGVFSRLCAWIVIGGPILILLGGLSGILGGVIGSFLAFSAHLPSIPDLKAYRPKTVSTFFAEDGSVIGLFYRERRFPVPLSELPPQVIHAFLAAEDARFFSHTGIDVFGIMRAFAKNLSTGNYTQGGSTITQQVTRNFLLSKEKKISRKIREAILAFRLEKNLSKNEILELYLNEIYLGRSSYGIEAAAGTYFGKSAKELTVPEAAFIAGLVSNPSKHSSNVDSAMKRREFVLGQMLKHGFITAEEHRQASAEEPKFRENLPNPFERVPYFTEAVRKYIIEKYGENRLYNEGLQVWTTCDLNFQDKAQDALIAGVKAWEKRRGRPAGLVRRLKPAEARAFLQAEGPSVYKMGDIVQAVVITNHATAKNQSKRTADKIQRCTMGLPGGAQFSVDLESDLKYRVNDVLEFRVDETQGSVLSLKQEMLPPVQGAMVCIENHTGYVRSLVGGLQFERSSFNRALQAVRQPGSAFKPFIYAAALEWAGYSPQTLIVDEPIAVNLNQNGPPWMPMNSDGRFHGPMTFRQALAHSRNIIAVKLLMDVGMDQTIETARLMGISSPLHKNLSLALGASEVTPLELTSAYTVFPNMGVRMNPVMVKKVVDRFGRVLEDNTVTPLDVSARTIQDGLRELETGPDETDDVEVLQHTENEQNRASEQRPKERASIVESIIGEKISSDANMNMQRVLSPQTAFLMIGALRETCVSGTAAATGRLRRSDLAGKTGTTDDCTDAWFVGFNSQYTTGVWMGFDAKVPLGRNEYGGTAALPVWMNFMKQILAGKPSTGYLPPPGIVFFENIDREKSLQPDPALLMAAPDLIPGQAIKQVCPIDTMYAPASAQNEAFLYGASTPDQVYSLYPHSVRVLAPNGQTLGYAAYSTDQKGRLTIERDSMIAAHADPYDEVEQTIPESTFEGSGVFGQRQGSGATPQFLPQGWYQ